MQLIYRACVLLAALFLSIGSTVQAVDLRSKAANRYEVKYFNCYLVGLYGVFDKESDKQGWDKMVSRPYVYGAVPDVQRMVKRWNERGRNPDDEAKLAEKLSRKGMFVFPESSGPAVNERVLPK